MTQQNETPTKEVVPIYIMGKRYDVPSSLTIQKALEFAGYVLIRGCGCRGGICGACGTVYRYPGTFKIEVGLACQTVVQENMYIAQIPFFPADKAKYDVHALEATGDAIGALYPDLYKCMGCNTCTKSCPMDIPVMEYISACLRGDLETAAELSFDCVMCGLCTARCPAELRQYHIAELARRLVAIHNRPIAPHLPAVVEKCVSGYHEKIMDKLLTEKDKWRDLYVAREIEPMEDSEDWQPNDKTGL
jgi:ferredoxin